MQENTVEVLEVRVIIEDSNIRIWFAGNPKGEDIYGVMRGATELEKIKEVFEKTVDEISKIIGENELQPLKPEQTY